MVRRPTVLAQPAGDPGQPVTLGSALTGCAHVLTGNGVPACVAYPTTIVACA